MPSKQPFYALVLGDDERHARVEWATSPDCLCEIPPTKTPPLVAVPKTVEQRQQPKAAKVARLLL
jgi:hypothetical protein